MKVKDLKNEVWKPVKLPSAHNSKKYLVSDRGRVKSVDKSTKSEYLLSLKSDQHGHLRASIKLADGKNYGLWVHKHMAAQFVKRPSRKHTLIIHKNFKRDDNKLNNLVWVTPDEHKEYIKKRLKSLGHVYHRKGGKPKLTEKKVAMIKKLMAKGKQKRYQIAEKYGVSVTQLKRIERGENWGHVKAAK